MLSYKSCRLTVKKTKIIDRKKCLKVWWQHNLGVERKSFLLKILCKFFAFPWFMRQRYINSSFLPCGAGWRLSTVWIVGNSEANHRPLSRRRLHRERLFSVSMTYPPHSLYWLPCCSGVAWTSRTNGRNFCEGQKQCSSWIHTALQSFCYQWDSYWSILCPYFIKGGTCREFCFRLGVLITWSLTLCC